MKGSTMRSELVGKQTLVLQGLRFLGLQVKITWATMLLKFSCTDSPRVIGNLFFCHKVLGVSVLSFKGDKVLQEVSTSRLNIEKLDGNIVQKHGGSKQVGFKQLGPCVKTGVHGVQDSNDDAAVAQRRLENKQLEEKTNTDFLVKDQEKGNYRSTMPSRQGGPRFEVPARGKDAEYQLCLNVTPKDRYRGDNNMAALGVVAVIEEYIHESLTFRDAVACEVISKWIFDKSSDFQGYAVLAEGYLPKWYFLMKEDMDTRSWFAGWKQRNYTLDAGSDIFGWTLYARRLEALVYLGTSDEKKKRRWVPNRGSALVKLSAYRE
ncbi:hypothetical protein Tco_1410314 [Tanacetum coccineum]